MNATDKVDQSYVTVIDEHTVEIAGVRYRRTDLPPEGYEERQVDNLMSITKDGGLVTCGWTLESDETPYTIFVPKEADDE